VSALPCLGRGRPTEARRAAYAADLAAFCDRILEIRSRLDFAVSSRGWCYLLEGEGLISKGEFDAAQRLINELRKTGTLPLDICAVDEKRSADGLEDIDDTDIDSEVEQIVSYVNRAHHYYEPFSFWDDQQVYVEILVEKVDLKSLFAQVAGEFHVPISNAGGWTDINGRAALMARFAEWENRGKRCILLYFGDHDPGGLHISEFLHANLAELERAVGWDPVNLTVDRFGLDLDFIETLGLTWIDNLETGGGGRLDDPRHPDHHKPYVQSYLKRFGARKVEANALVTRPREGRELCRQAILKYVSADALDHYQAELDYVRDELRQAIVRRLGGVLL
jgi:hypothetical protein